MHDIIIVGAGPAGLTAAIYALRAGKSVLLLEREVFGGQITYSPSVENYPGFRHISGNEFADAALDQVFALGADTEMENVISVKKDGDKISVLCDDGKVFDGRALIIASGSRHRHLGLEREDELTGRGVSYCAVCDGAFFKGKPVAVAGGGDSALQDALYLSERSSKVYVVHRRDEFRAEARLVDKLKSRDNIELVLSANVKELIGEGKLSGIKVVSAKDGSERTIEVDGLFIAVGQMPQNEPFGELISLDASGYASSGEDCATKSAGVFVAGDCRKKDVRQLTTAVGDGAVAALAACRYLEAVNR